MILIDTSIWIDHFNKGPDERIERLLVGESVLIHSFVFGEIAMGSLKNRRQRLIFLGDLHHIPTATELEVRTLVENEGLHGSGLSYIDAHLLTAARAAPERDQVRIWTRDNTLYEHAERLDVAYAA